MCTAGPQRADRMSEGMPNRMPDKISDRLPQDMPDRIPEGLPDNNVGCLIVITPPKFIFSFLFRGGQPAYNNFWESIAGIMICI